MQNSVNRPFGSARKQVAFRRIAELQQSIESHASFDELLRLISSEENRDDYVSIARSLFSDVILDADSDNILRSAVSAVAVKHLTETIRKAHAGRVCHVFTSETASKAGQASQQSPNGKKDFDREEQIRGILTRGERPWSDAEEMVLIALAQKFKKERSGRMETDWFAVAERMNTVFPLADLDRLTCRRHGLAIFERHRNGKYGRGMPATHRDAFERAIDSLLPPTNGVNDVTAYTISHIRFLLSQEPHPTDQEVIPVLSDETTSLIREVTAFVKSIEMVNIDASTKNRAVQYRRELLHRDAEVEALGKGFLYKRLTAIADARSR